MMAALRPNNKNTTKTQLSLGLNLSLHKLPIALAVAVVIIVVALIIWLAVGANTAEPPQPPGASSTQENSSTPGETTATPINLNTADVATLEQLPGIGEVRAQAIVNYRNANGPFNTIEDILNVKGIGPETFAQIKESITV
jgi:comEA protein